MIIYGSRGKELGREVIIDKCPNCSTQNSIDMHVFQKYAHIFWIPIFPIGKTGISQCDNCKQVLKLKEMPTSLVTSYNNLKSQTKTPIWMFTGLFLIAILIVLGVIGDKNRSEKNAQFIAAPKTGDIFEIKTKENQYTLYKIYEVQGDSVFVLVNNYETNKVKGLKDLKNKEFSTEILGFTKLELKQMLDNGEIIDIDRK